MQWWNDMIDWITSDEGWRVVTDAIIPALAILVAALLGAAIGRAPAKKLVAQRDRETRAAAVAALVSAGQQASTWHSQSPAVREHAERIALDADIAVRLLPIAGSDLAADWASHELASMRTNSVNYSFQADQTLAEYRSRLVEWLHKPGRAKKLFAADLQRWKYEGAESDPVVLEQQRWAQEQFSAQAEPVSDATPAEGTSTAEERPTAVITTGTSQ